MDIVVRDAFVGDAAALAEIHVRAWQVAYEELMNKEYLAGLSVSQRESQWKGILENPGNRKYLVAEKGSAVRAFAAYGAARDRDVDKDTAELIALNVNPDFWRERLGETLLQAVMTKSREEGCEGVYLWVISGNTAAISLYKKYGFSHTGVSKTTDEHSGCSIDEDRYYASLL